MGAEAKKERRVSDCNGIEIAKIGKREWNGAWGKKLIHFKNYDLRIYSKQQKKYPNACQSLFWTNNLEIVLFLSMNECRVLPFRQLYSVIFMLINQIVIAPIHSSFLFVNFIEQIKSLDVNYIKVNTSKRRRRKVWMKSVFVRACKITHLHFFQHIICNNEITIL